MSAALEQGRLVSSEHLLFLIHIFKDQQGFDDEISIQVPTSYQLIIFTTNQKVQWVMAQFQFQIYAFRILMFYYRVIATKYESHFNYLVN